MAYNINTGETILNGRTYTPNRRGALLHFRSFEHIADSSAALTGETRHVLIAATRALYRITDDRTAFLVGRSVIRGLRDEAAADQEGGAVVG
ncbi:hypothetical protein, partial [Streptomyces scabiei]